MAHRARLPYHEYSSACRLQLVYEADRAHIRGVMRRDGIRDGEIYDGAGKRDDGVREKSIIMFIRQWCGEFF